MWTSNRNNYKAILKTLGLFTFGVASAFLAEDYYRQLVRFFFKFFNGDNINFIGKNFHLFANIKFVLSFGLFCSLTFLVLNRYKFYNRLKAMLYSTAIFILTTIFISLLDSKRLIIECTACNDGIRTLTYNEITYDFYFITSLIVSFLATAWLIFRHNKSFDNLIGLWTKEDDGSGLLAIFGWSFNFKMDKTGEYKYWESNLNESLGFDFLWERLNENSIKIKAITNDKWTTLNYEIIEEKGTYNSRQFKLKEINKNEFWNSPEPIYRRK